MADKALSSLTAVSSLDTGDTIYVVQGGNSRKSPVGRIFNDKLTARGDILVRGATTSQRLPIGPAGYHLASDTGGDAVWVGPAIASVKDPPYSAVGDGITDDTAAIQAAISNGGLVYFPSGEYLLSDTIDLVSDLMVIMAPDAVISAPSGVSPAFAATGTAGSDLEVAENVPRGTTEFDLTDASTIAAGDLILIGDDVRRLTTAPKEGEFHYVVSKATNTLTLGEATWGSYTTAQNAIVRKITPLKNIHIRGGQFEGAGAAANQNAAIHFTHVDGFSIDGTRINGFDDNGVKLTGCLNGSNTRLYIEDITDSSLGYAIVHEAGCQWITTERCQSCNAGKLWDVGGDDDQYGVSRFLTVRECAAYDAARGGISTHETAEYVLIENNDVYGVHGSANGAIFTRNVNVTVRNNRVHQSASSGIFCDTRGSAGYIEVLDNKVFDATSHGIVVNVSDSTDTTLNAVPDRIDIRGNYATATLRGILVQSNNTDTDAKNIRIIGNDATSSTLDGIMVRAVANDLSDVAILGNRAQGDDSGIWVHRDSTFVASNVLVAGNTAIGDTLYGVRFTAVAGGYVDGNQLSGATALLNGLAAGQEGKNYNLDAAAPENAWHVVGSSAVAATHTGDTAETTLATVTIPADLIGPNGIVKITTVWSFINTTGGNKTARIRFGGTGGTLYLNAIASSSASRREQIEIFNVNATNSQKGGANSVSFGTSGGAATTSSVDTTEAVAISIRGLLADGTDSITLESYLVEVLRRP